MGKYTIQKVDRGCFQLVENASSNVIASFPKWEEARQASQFFSSGVAFDGWTPAFMLKEQSRINRTTQQHFA